MRCNQCNTRLALHDLWCVGCGRQRPIVKTELSSMRSLGNTWAQAMKTKSANIPAGGFSVILGAIPIAVLIWLFSSIITFDGENLYSLLLGLAVKSIAFSLFVPFVLIGFNGIARKDEYSIGFKTMLSSLKSYPRYLVFSLTTALYYTIIYLICFGLPNFGSDPILRLVWVVLLNYWVAILLPVPALMERLQIPFFTALKTSYRHFHVVRWNLYLLALVLVLLNIAGAILFVVPLAITIPLSWFAIRDYTDLLLEYELIRAQK
ncbi:MAG: hypothetical protein Q8M98_07720 [Candidatus Cloacimonadaceae bacterium]|nr:hypothetical protein [Candidatus Cloacimonadaceae bacterium]MDP3114651.1 hypothetical protein [Candidatus Cloacimonadaceae bacterium]